MNEKHKDEFNSTEDKFSELGQQAGAMLGQLFASAEQFGRQVSKESQAWSESRPSTEPFASALRQAGEEFRATANRAAEDLSDSFRNNPVDPSEDNETVVETSDADDIKPGNVRKIGGAARQSAQRSNADEVGRRSSAGNKQTSTDSIADHRSEQLAEMFRNDRGLSELTAGEFNALKTLLEKQYRDIREFQRTK